MPSPDLSFADPLTARLLAAWVVLLGATVGSFLNVVIARLPAGLSLVRPRSRCPRCGHPIAWYDNVPVVSWLVLRGRCRSCRGPISLRYPLVEAAVAAAALAAFLRHGLSAAAFAELVLVALLLALSLIDLDTWHLPHELTWPLIAVGLLVSWAGRGGVTGLSSTLGAAVGFATFGAIWLLGEKVLHRELMGLGDAFLLAGVGAWLGVGALLPVVLLASVQGSVVGLVQLALGRAHPGPPQPVPSAQTEASTPTDLSAPAAVAPPAESPPPSEPPAPASGEPGAATEEEAWIPPRHSVPFGPFLAAGALEWLYLAGWLASRFSLLSVFR